ncbi:MAG: NapC/NirT family cytochrome c [Alphaproteobacteria bacterium]
MFNRRILSILGFVVLGGILGLGVAGISASMIESTSTNEFCVSCHEMTWPQETYQNQPHFKTASGVRPGCGDCHIPHHPWYKMVWAKATQGTRDIWLSMRGKLDTVEKYREHRAEMAKSVWARMKENDSQTCRSCHLIEAMDLEEQKPAAKMMHGVAREKGTTCIECHKGIGHGEKHTDAAALN